MSGLLLGFRVSAKAGLKAFVLLRTIGVIDVLCWLYLMRRNLYLQHPKGGFTI